MIDVKNLCKTYKTKHKNIDALKDISFHVEKGEIFGIIGRNGAGKSTLIKILGTALNYEKGNIIINSYPMTRPLDIRKSLTVVLQTSSVEPWLSVEDNLVVFSKFFGLNRREIKEKMDYVIELFELQSHRKIRANELSGGLRKRLQLARSFMVDVPIMIFDEPTAGVDPIAKRKMIDLIKNMASIGKTIIFTTQILDEAESLCDQIMILDDGKSLSCTKLIDLKKKFTKKQKLILTFDTVTDEIRHKANEISDYYGTPLPKQNGDELYFLINESMEHRQEMIQKLFIELNPNQLKKDIPELETIFTELVKGRIQE